MFSPLAGECVGEGQLGPLAGAGFSYATNRLCRGPCHFLSPSSGRVHVLADSDPASLFQSPWDVHWHLTEVASLISLLPFDIC